MYVFRKDEMCKCMYFRKINERKEVSNHAALLNKNININININTKKENDQQVYRSIRLRCNHAVKPLYSMRMLHLFFI